MPKETIASVVKDAAARDQKETDVMKALRLEGDIALRHEAGAGCERVYMGLNSSCGQKRLCVVRRSNPSPRWPEGPTENRRIVDNSTTAPYVTIP
jgi:hypothetical protein